MQRLDVTPLYRSPVGGFWQYLYDILNERLSPHSKTSLQDIKKPVNCLRVVVARTGVEPVTSGL